MESRSSLSQTIPNVYIKTCFVFSPFVKRALISSKNASARYRIEVKPTREKAVIDCDVVLHGEHFKRFQNNCFPSKNIELKPMIIPSKWNSKDGRLYATIPLNFSLLLFSFTKRKEVNKWLP